MLPLIGILTDCLVCINYGLFLPFPWAFMQPSGERIQVKDAVHLPLRSAREVAQELNTPL